MSDPWDIYFCEIEGKFEICISCIGYGYLEGN
ncbi:hypothetical protein PAV_8c00780 [Paenibacillus alvei DSM 29]|nr:hypothetical protein PAV_8c00780 [Paenibacillus alvei DSM 29]